MKYCPKCNITKNDEGFALSQLKINGGWCRSCMREYQKQHYQNNKDYYKSRNEKYEVENKDKRKEQRNNWSKENPEYGKVYRYNNRDMINTNKRNYVNSKYRTNEKFRLRINVSRAINNQLKMNGYSKSRKSILNYLSYTMYELKSHIEKQFEPWMTWENQGRYDPQTWDDNNSATWTWQLDHIIPQSKLPYISMEDDNFKKCWALENLRPLSAKQNVIDSNKRIY
jgi:hypothetical protein